MAKAFFWISYALGFLASTARLSGFAPVSCPSDWSIDPPNKFNDNQPALLHCQSSETFTCNPQSCYIYPVCHNCTSSKRKNEIVKCTKEYHAGNPEDLTPTICVDDSETLWSCPSSCIGTLQCSQCWTDVPALRKQLYKRGNPFAASMSGATGNSGSNFDSALSL